MQGTTVKKNHSNCSVGILSRIVHRKYKYALIINYIIPIPQVMGKNLKLLNEDKV
jgi:hypothetical protein